MIEVLKPGLQSSLQDTGRPGYAHLGIGRSGAADRPAMRLANALVGNREEACVIEMTLHGPRLRLHRDAHVAITGAPLPNARCDDAPVKTWRTLHLDAGCELDLGAMATGCRSYLAIDGGMHVQPWLGSRSSDLNASTGPMQGRALKAGDRIKTGSPIYLPEPEEPWSLDPRPWFEFSDESENLLLRLLPASHTDTLDEQSRTAMTQSAFRVQSDSNRVGVRLQSETPLHLDQPLELISEGVTAGVMQLPPGGQPIILLSEHPVTGGYPRIAQLAAVDLPRLAQCRPGDNVQFTWITRQQAEHALREHHQGLDCLCADIKRRLEPDT